MRDALKPTARAWLVVGLLWVVACLNYLDRLMIVTMRDSLKESIAMTDVQFGLLTSVFLWVYCVLSPLGGFLADRFSRSRVIIGSLLAWSAVTWLTGHVHTFEQLLFARALMGVSEACYIPAALALIVDYHRGSTRSLATGIHLSGVYAGTALGGLGGYIAEHYQWQTAFTMFGIIGVMYAFVLVGALRDAKISPLSASPEPPEAQKVRPMAALSALFRQRSFLVLASAVALLAMAYWSIYGWLPTYLREHFKLGQGAAGMSATGYIQVASFAGILGGGAWADIWSRTNVRGRLLIPVIAFCAAAPALFMSASTDALVVAIAGLIVFGLARGACDANLMPILCQVVHPRYRATGYGFLNFFSCLAGGLMIYAGGALKDAHIGLGRTFQFAALGAFAAALLLLLVKPRRELESA